MKAKALRKLDLKLSPSSSGTTIAVIPGGTMLMVTRRMDDLWVQVVYGGKTGYVMSCYLGLTGRTEGQ